MLPAVQAVVENERFGAGFEEPHAQPGTSASNTMSGWSGLPDQAPDQRLGELFRHDCRS